VKITLLDPAGRQSPLEYRTGVRYLGLVTVAALTGDRAEIVYVDERRGPVDFDAKTDLVGITALTFQAGRAYAVADEYRRRGVPVVMGGMHATLLPEEAAAHADCVVRGEAEALWPIVLDDFAAGRLKPLYESSERSCLDRMVHPRRDLQRRPGYVPMDLIQTTRGCPMNCDYCVVPSVLGRQCRNRPVAEVVAELAAMERIVMFVDDNMLVNRDYFTELFRAMVPRGKLWSGLGSYRMKDDPALLDLMAASGCWALYVDIGPWLSLNLKPGKEDLPQKRKFVDFFARLKGLGIKVIGAFTVGFDVDDESIFERTVAFAREVGMEEAEFNLVTPYPKTRLRAKLEAQGRLLTRDWHDHSTTRVTYVPRRMTPERLQEGYEWMWREFYAHADVRMTPDGPVVRTDWIFPDESKLTARAKG
jgi:radical SAM superfamily enzyme YgiQ (UPF0313 family)